MIKSENAMKLIYEEYNTSIQQHPNWPTDPIHASAILAEESGELTQACLDYVYRDADGKAAFDEAIQCGAMALRFLVNVGTYVKGKDGKDKRIYELADDAISILSCCDSEEASEAMVNIDQIAGLVK